MQKHIITLLCAAGIIISTPAVAENLRIKSGAPTRYTVQQGDTLWGISGKYLYRPWKWPALWQVNRNQIRNPHLIYPGQVLVLRYVNGKPVLSSEGGIPTIKLSPRIREAGSGYGINTINVNFYSMFMKHPQFIDRRDLATAARLVGGPDNQMMYSVGDRVYADGVQEHGDYLIFRVKHDLKDPINGKKIGTLTEFVGEASTLATQNSALSHRTAEANARLAEDEYFVAAQERKANRPDVAVRTAQPLVITQAVSEISEGDYLIRKPENMNAFNMMPHEPQGSIDASIVDIMDGVAESGMMQTILINKGSVDGLDKGTVLGIYKRGRIIQSDWRDEDNKKAVRRVNTPNEEIGLAMVYRVGENVSSAIILESIANVSKDNLIAEPGRDLDTFGTSKMNTFKPMPK
ncbi:MAG: LysM peptidoglycan-binding domain-containing protein [Alysiella sp.]|uniref:LysM peptidoglycan-binding domain-containing protein n=1 Tax=Alysiella sp. TaxID=1872483 RepID=UPI0026DBE5DE|nr:LysM peptidoglycan-binding domain-containing protein [Alysiella sp.]MDO4434111.1 LysM peptidoglycan-binding domain-containing protein [Alysiella sp.]